MSDPSGIDLTDTHKDKYEDKDKDIQEEDAPEKMHQRRCTRGDAHV